MVVPIIEVYLSLMNEVDNENLIQSLQFLIKAFQNEANQFAPFLLEKLVIHSFTLKK